MDWLTERITQQRQILDMLLIAPPLPFDQSLRSKLPERHGLYAISIKGAPPGEFIRAGRTKEAASGLRQRVYQNHLMGNQKGNLRSQLVKDGSCADLDQAKLWIRNHCVVQFVCVDDYDMRQWSEHFMLAVLRPKHGD